MDGNIMSVSSPEFHNERLMLVFIILCQAFFNKAGKRELSQFLSSFSGLFVID